MKCVKGARNWRSILSTQTFTSDLPPCVTFRQVAVSLRGPGQSPVLPSACCAGSLRSVGRCVLCSRGMRWRAHALPFLSGCKDLGVQGLRHDTLKALRGSQLLHLLGGGGDRAPQKSGGGIHRANKGAHMISAYYSHWWALGAWTLPRLRVCGGIQVFGGCRDLAPVEECGRSPCSRGHHSLLMQHSTQRSAAC